MFDSQRKIAERSQGYRDDSDAVSLLVEGKGFALLSKETSVNFHIRSQGVENQTHQSLRPYVTDMSYSTWLLGKNSPLTTRVNSFLHTTFERGIYQQVRRGKTEAFKADL